MIYIIIYNLLSACMLIASKYTTQYASPLVITTIRTGCAGVITLIWYSLCSLNRRSTLQNILWHDWVAICIVGLFHSFLRSMLSFWSMQYLTASNIALTIYLTPFICAGLSYIIFREKMSLNKWLGMMISFVGIIALQGCILFLPSCTSQFYSMIILLLAVICNVAGMMIMQYLLQIRRIPIVMVSSGSLLFSHCLSVVTLIIFPELIRIDRQSAGWFMILMIGISFLHSIIVYMKSYLIKKYSPTLVAFSYFMMPLWTSLFGYVFFSEIITISSILAFLCITIGLYMFYQQE